MSLHPHDGPAAEGSSCSALCAADESQRIERLQQMLSTFSHRCRNSLNGIKMSMYLFKREFGDPAPQYCSELERTYQELEILFDRLQLIYRPLSVTFVRSPLGQLFRERLPSWRSWMRTRAKTIELSPPASELAGDFDPMYLGIGLDALVKWRAESGCGARHGPPRLADHGRPLRGQLARDQAGKQRRQSGGLRATLPTEATWARESIRWPIRC